MCYGEDDVAKELEEQRNYEQTHYHNGYLIADLRREFNQICNPNDWRGPIVGVIPRGKLSIVQVAVAYFTGTNLSVSITSKPDEFQIESVGYRNGPCGP